MYTGMGNDVYTCGVFVYVFASMCLLSILTSAPYTQHRERASERASERDRPDLDPKD
jgi:hypothetical protein